MLSPRDKWNVLKEGVGLKRGRYSFVILTQNRCFVFGAGRVSALGSGHGRRHGPGSMVQGPWSSASVVLGLPAASLVVDHRQQNPQVQKSCDDEPHQNCHKHIPVNVLTFFLGGESSSLLPDGGQTRRFTVN